jgi:hypothetical protein
VTAVAGAEKSHRAVDPAAHGHGYAALILRRGKRGAERIVERVSCQRLTGNTGSGERRQSAHRGAKVGDSWPLPGCPDEATIGDLEADPRDVTVARRVPDQLCHGIGRTPPRR